MKRIAFFDEHGSLVVSGPPEISGGSDAVLVSPLDVHTYVVALPPLKEAQLAGAVRFRLRALHPGNPDNARVEQFANGKKRTSVVAFVAEAGIAAKYRSAGARSYPPLHFMRSMAPPMKGNWLALFCAPNWAEATLFDDDEVTAIETGDGSQGIENIAVLALSIVKGEALDGLPVRLFFIGGHAPPIETVARALAGRGAGAVERFDITAINPRALNSDGALFLETTGRKRRNGRYLAALVAIDLVLATIAVRRAAANREGELARLKTVYAATKRKLAETERAAKELEVLEKRRSDYIMTRPVDAYATVAEISRCVGARAWITDLTIRGDSFAIEAEGTDSLAVLARSNASPKFAAVSLRQAHPSSQRGEAFSISGKIRDDR